MADQYEVIKALSYEDKRVEPGEVVDDIPAESVEWLLEAGAIAPAGEQTPSGPEPQEEPQPDEGDGTGEQTESGEQTEGGESTDGDEPADEDPLAEVPEGATFPYHLGGGYYILSDGSKPEERGREAAEAAQAAIAGDG